MLSDDDEQHGAMSSLALMRKSAEQKENNRICIWLEDV